MLKMKRIIIKEIIAVIFLLIITAIIYKSMSPRGYARMEHLANIRFEEKIDKENIRDKVNGFNKLPPKVVLDDGIIFSWYYILENGDSAILNIQVNRRGKFLQDEQFCVTMNNKWSYLLKTKVKYINVLPLKHAGDSSFLKRSVLFDNQDEYLNSIDSFQVLIPTEKLFSYLKEGYFSVLKRYEDYTVIAFYEPIATVIREKESKPILTAKVYFNDRNEVLIFPYDAPLEIWANYNKE